MLFVEAWFAVGYRVYYYYFIIKFPLCWKDKPRRFYSFNVSFDDALIWWKFEGETSSHIFLFQRESWHEVIYFLAITIRTHHFHETFLVSKFHIILFLEAVITLVLLTWYFMSWLNETFSLLHSVLSLLFSMKDKRQPMRGNSWY